MIKPVQDIIVVEPIDPEQPRFGIIIPEIAEKKITFGIVHAIGPKVKEVAVGDTVVYNDWSGLEFESNEKTYLGMREKDIEGVVG